MGVLRTFRPFLFKLEVLCVLFRGRRVLEEMRDMFDVEHFDRLRSLNLDCKLYLPRDPHRIVADTLLAFPLHMCGLTTLRLRGVDVGWSISHPFRIFHHLFVLVLRDMGHRVPFTWTEFFNLFTGMPKLQKLAVANVRCSALPLDPLALLPRLDFLTDIRMRCVSGLSLHLHTTLDRELVAFTQCFEILTAVTSFIYSGWASDALYSYAVFMCLPSLTRLSLSAPLFLSQGKKFTDNRATVTLCHSRVQARCIERKTINAERRTQLDFSIGSASAQPCVFKWRTIVLDNIEFGGHLQVHAAVPLAFLHSCLLRSKQTSLFIRLHLIGMKTLVDVTTGVHVNGSSSVGVFRALRPFLFQFEVLCVIFRGRWVLEELRRMFEMHNFGRLRALNMDFKPYLPHGPYRLTVDVTIGFPLDMHALTTLRLRGVDVDRSISRPLHQLSILVLRDMGP
ncbi:hypothetical protein C8J57DRAFT_1503952 [Mycena rebaudengoi]|nr:hypothetical protein C8J57DRAFT_1503952 [Mycena rebaudengoi]